MQPLYAAILEDFNPYKPVKYLSLRANERRCGPARDWLPRDIPVVAFWQASSSGFPELELWSPRANNVRRAQVQPQHPRYTDMICNTLLQDIFVRLISLIEPSES